MGFRTLGHAIRWIWCGMFRASHVSEITKCCLGQNHVFYSNYSTLYIWKETLAFVDFLKKNPHNGHPVTSPRYVILWVHSLIYVLPLTLQCFMYHRDLLDRVLTTPDYISSSMGSYVPIVHVWRMQFFRHSLLYTWEGSCICVAIFTRW